MEECSGLLDERTEWKKYMQLRAIPMEDVEPEWTPDGRRLNDEENFKDWGMEESDEGEWESEEEDDEME